MPRADPIQNNFTAGEINPLLTSQSNTDVYRAGLDLLKNWLVYPQGSVTKRPGTKYVATPNNGASSAVRLIPFVFSREDAYILAFSNNTIRVYKNQAEVTGPVDIPTTYTTSQLFDIQYAQYGDILFLVHPDHEPQYLERTSDTVWSLTPFFAIPTSNGRVRQGPWVPNNTLDAGDVRTDITITPGAVTGTTTLTSSVGIFAASDVSRLFRVFDSSGAWTFGQITGFNSATNVDFVIIGPDFPNTTARAIWAFGLYTPTSGPRTVALHQQRLVFGGSKLFPQRLDFSSPEDIHLFNHTERDNSVDDSTGIRREIHSKEVNEILWLESDEQGLLVGTAGAEWVVTGALGAGGGVITPSNVTADRISTYGSNAVNPAKVGRSVIATSRSRRNLREIRFADSLGGYNTREAGIISDHLFRPDVSQGYPVFLPSFNQGIKEYAYQQDPYSRLWLANWDGKAVVATNTETELGILSGFSRVELGGFADVAGNPARILSIAVIPSTLIPSAPSSDPGQQRTEVWMIVERYINGLSTQYIELLTIEFEDLCDLSKGIFLDSSLSLDNPNFVSIATNANPVAITTLFPHGFSTSDVVKFRKIVGMTELNSGSYTITVTGGSTFTLDSTDGTSFGTFVAGSAQPDVNEVRKTVSAVSGLSHLEGETVQVVGDGLVQTDKTVSSGAITLDSPAAIIHVGYKYNSDLRMLRHDVGSATGTALGKTQRSQRIGLDLYKTVNLLYGRDFDKLYESRLNQTDLFSGTLTLQTDVNYELGNKLCLRADKPLPATVLAIMPSLTTQDR